MSSLVHFLAHASQDSSELSLLATFSYILHYSRPTVLLAIFWEATNIRHNKLAFKLTRNVGGVEPATSQCLKVVYVDRALSH